MKIVEQFLQSKTGKAKDCEDGLYISDDFIAVIDVATSKGEGNTLKGKAAADVVLAGFDSLDVKVDAKGAIDHLTTTIYQYYEQNGLTKICRNNPAERLTCVAAIYSRYHQQIWLLGDCQALVNGHHYQQEKKVDTVLASARSFYLATEIVQGRTVEDLLENDTGRTFIVPLLKRQMAFQNSNETQNPYHYGALDGFAVQESDIRVISNISGTVVLASDGYPDLCSTLDKTENRLETILAQDPLCMYANKGTKGIKKGNLSFDDRCYIRFNV